MGVGKEGYMHAFVLNSQRKSIRVTYHTGGAFDAVRAVREILQKACTEHTRLTHASIAKVPTGM